MIRKLLTLTITLGLLVGLTLGLPGIALAQEGCPDGTAASETITCTADDTTGVEGEAGDDTIIVNAGVTVSENIDGDDSFSSTDGGNDTITNYGTADTILGENIIAGNGGDDIITNSGTVVNNIRGDVVTTGNGGDDTITNSDTVGGTLWGDNVATGNGGADIITNTGTVGSAIYGDNITTGDGGADSITNSGTVSHNIMGDRVVLGNGGDDTIDNSGIVEDSIVGDWVEDGDGGDDIITNSGTVQDSIYGDVNLDGDGGDDIITNSGTVGKSIFAAEGDDTVILVGSNVNVGGTIKGGEGVEDEGGDTLNFSMSTSDQNEFGNASAAINNAIGNGHADGSFAWNGGTITWVEFENLINNLQFLGTLTVAAPAAAPAADDSGSATPTTTVFSDANVSVSRDSESGALYFYGENGASDHLIASVSASEYSGAGAGQVLVTVVDTQLGVLLYVEALGNGQLVVQYYSTADGSLLSSVVISV